MKQRFAFPLERLARVRSIAEQEARSNWARAEREADAAAAALRTAEHELERARADLRDLLSGGSIAPGRILLLQSTLTSLGGLVTKAKAAWRAKRAIADVLAGTWRSRKQECESLERLRERGRSRHRSELSAAEARGMDDVALQRMAAQKAAEKRAAKPPSLIELPNSSREGFPADIRTES